MKVIGEINDEIYEALINYAFQKCDAIMLVSHPLGLTNEEVKLLNKNIKELQEKFKPSIYKIRHDNYWVHSASYKGPGKYLPLEIKNQFNIMFYKLDNSIKEYLLTNKDLYNWINPDYPEDISFFKNGYCWLYSVAHEEMCDIYCESREEYEYLKSIGIKFFEKDFEPTPKEHLYYEDYGLNNIKADSNEE